MLISRAPSPQHCALRRRVVPLPGHDYAVEPRLRRFKGLRGPVPLVKLVDKSLARLALPGKYDLLDPAVHGVDVLVELLEYLFQLAGEELEGGEINRYVVVAFTHAFLSLQIVQAAGPKVGGPAPDIGSRKLGCLLVHVH